MKPHHLLAALSAAFAIGLLSLPALADAPASSFAWQWPINGGEGVLQIELDESVYRHIQRDDLGDLVALDASGQRVPMGPYEQVWSAPVRRAPAAVTVPFFVLPVTDSETGIGDAVELHLRRADDGRLTSLDASVTPGGSAATPGGDLLLDLSALKMPIEAMTLELDVPTDADFQARVRVDGSDDLNRWSSVGGEQSLLQLHRDGFALNRNQLQLPPTRLPYLRLHRLDGSDGIPLRAVSVQPLSRLEVSLPRQSSLQLSGEPVADSPGEFVYRSPGPIPVAHLDVKPAAGNQVSAVIVSSRKDDQQAWRERARFTAFHMTLDGEPLDSERVAVAANRSDLRDREWRVQTRPALREAPTLRLDYTPDRFVLLAQGAAPYRLAAGSATATRESYPLPELLAEIRRSRDEDWRPPQATLGNGSALDGDVALQTPSEPLPIRQIVLWAVLIGSALLLLMLVGRLLRQRSDDRADL